MAPYDRLKRLLAASATFQTLVGAADETAALNSIFCPEALDITYPRAIVHPNGNMRGRKVGTALWANEGDASVTIEAEVPASDAGDVQDEMLWFSNRIGAMVSEMQTLAGRGQSVAGESHLNVIRWSQQDIGRDEVTEVEHIDIGDRKARWWTVLLAEWF